MSTQHRRKDIVDLVISERRTAPCVVDAQHYIQQQNHVAQAGMDKFAAHAGECAITGALRYLPREDVVPVLEGLAVPVPFIPNDRVQPVGRRRDMVGTVD